MKKKHRVPLSVKVYAFLAFVLLELSAGLILIGYRASSRQVDEAYYNKAELAIQSLVDADLDVRARHLLSRIDTEEYAHILQKAQESGDETIIRRWMESKPDGQGRTDSDGGSFIQDELIPFSLYTDYLFLLDSLQYLKNLFQLSSAYIEYDRDNVTYNLVSSSKELLETGQAQPSLEAFEKYEDNASIPPTAFQENGEWLISTCKSVMAEVGTDEEGTAVCVLGVDLNMTKIVSDRHKYINNSILFVILLSSVNILVCLLIVRQSVTNRIVKLAQAVTSFASGEQSYSKEMVVGADSGQNDEIRDLYDATRSMQIRMIDYTADLTRITAEKERINTELDLAAQIQLGALPDDFPPFPDRKEFSLFARTQPAREVGGDFYDYFLIDEDHLALLIADVSGKGIPAALFMMGAKTLIGYRAQKEGSPAQILESVNRQLRRHNRQNMFVTVWLGILEISTGALTYTNAGHTNPVICSRDGKARIMKDPHDLVMGAVEIGFHDLRLRLNDGDVLFLYSDGLTEAQSTENTFFEEKGVAEAFSRIDLTDPEHIIRGMWQELEAFTEGAEQFDDITMLCLQYHPQAPSATPSA